MFQITRSENSKNSNKSSFQESLESREALASEVAEKHDQVMSLRKELQLLEEECHHLNMHVQYKEDVIKKLREERIQTKEKVCTFFIALRLQII